MARFTVIRGNALWAAVPLALGAMVACGSNTPGGGRGSSGGAGGAGGAVGGAASSCPQPPQLDCYGDCDTNPIFGTCTSQGTWECPSGNQPTQWCTSESGGGAVGTSGQGGRGGGGVGTAGAGGIWAMGDAQADVGPKDGAVDVATGCDKAVALRAIAALGLTATSTAQTLSQTLPAVLATDPDWGLKAAACQQGGYDITALAGSSVCLLLEEITQSCQGYPAEVWVIMNDGVTACVYKTLGPGALIVPGVYPATDSQCHD